MQTETDWTPAQKQRAKNLMYRALERGALIRAETCEHCGKSSTDNGEALDGHHHNGYDDEHALDVVWLCRSCHVKAHGSKVPRGFYAWDFAHRSRTQREAWAARTPEQRSEAARKGHCTRRHGRECDCWQR